MQTVQRLLFFDCFLSIAQIYNLNMKYVNTGNKTAPINRSKHVHIFFLFLCKNFHKMPFSDENSSAQNLQNPLFPFTHPPCLHLSVNGKVIPAIC